jgi:hypothetical protein
MMLRRALIVIAVDAVLLVTLSYVLLDLQWRTSYAASPHDACGRICSYSASYGYTLFIRFFTMSGNGATLTSPATFDWVQGLVFAIVILNAWFAYKVLQSRKPRALAAGHPSEESTSNR